MAVTIADLAKQSTEPLQKGILMNLYRFSPLMEYVPFVPAAALDNIVVRWNKLPTVGSRKFNEGYDESTGTTEQLTESIRPIGGDVDVENVFDQVSNVLEKPSVTQINMKTKAMAFLFNRLFVKGSPTLDPDAFYGLEWRINNSLPARQKFAIGNAGTPFDATASTANQHNFIDALHELNDLVGGASVYLCNRKMRLGVGRVLRRANVLDTTKDQFDRVVYSFHGAPILDAGLLSDKSTEIITDTEDPGDGGNDTTSIYAVKFGEGEGIVGVQLSPLKAYLVTKELESKPAARWRIDWVVGLAGFEDAYAARMYNVEPAASWT